MTYPQGSCRFGRQWNNSEYETTDYTGRTASLFDYVLQVFLQTSQGNRHLGPGFTSISPQRIIMLYRKRREEPNAGEMDEPDFKMAARLSRVMLRKVAEPTSNVANDDEHG